MKAAAFVTHLTAVRPLGILLLTLLVYSQVLRFDFVNLDDGTHLMANPHLSHLEQQENAGRFSEIWRVPYKALYIPMTYSVWALFTRDGFYPQRLHALNLLLHLISCALIVYPLLCLWLGSNNPSRANGAAFWGALCFALHPLQVESVAWISGLKDVLSGFFALGALYTFTLHLKESQRRWLFPLSTFLFVLALLSKPSSAVTPFIALIGGRFFLKASWKSLSPLLLWMLILVPVGFLTLESQSDLKLPFVLPSWPRRIWVAVDALGFYASKFIWPFQLAVDYGRNPAIGWDAEAAKNLFLGLACLGSAAGCLRHPRWKALGAALLLAMVALLPVLGLKPFVYQTTSTVADRYCYLSFLGVGAFLGLLFQKAAKYRFTALGFALLTVFWAGRTYEQSLVWESSFRLFENVLRVNPQSWLGYNNLASAYESTQNKELALSYYRKSVQIHPHVAGFSSIAFLEMQGQQPQKARLALEEALKKGLHHPAIYYNLSVAHQALGNQKDANYYFQLARQMDPTLGAQNGGS